MERFIQLNLRDDSAKAEAENPSNSEPKASTGNDKIINLMANKAAHKAASNFARSNSGIFSK
jgi:hypothetical protein